MASPIVSWSFVNDQMTLIEEAKDANDLLTLICSKEREIEALERVPQIIHFYWALVEMCDHRITKEDVLNLKTKGVIAKFDKEGKVSALWEDFKKCWRCVKDSVQEQGCNAQIGAENETVEIGDDELLSSVIGTDEDKCSGIIKTIRDGMGRLQDGILDKVNTRCSKHTNINAFISFSI